MREFVIGIVIYCGGGGGGGDDDDDDDDEQQGGDGVAVQGTVSIHLSRCYIEIYYNAVVFIVSILIDLLIVKCLNSIFSIRCYVVIYLACSDLI
jgi:hypothetical protein